jgi:succinoglycan biosynthesis protein ExoM
MSAETGKVVDTAAETGKVGDTDTDTDTDTGTAADGVTVAVCVCTFRRASLARTLASVRAQVLPPGMGLRVIVADNDDLPSAAGMAEGAHYVHAPARNISLARNACLDAAGGDLVAFIDDDEVAEADWIARAWACLKAHGADAVFGPVRAVYPPETPAWLRACDFHANLPQVRDGRVETGHSCNVLMRPTSARFRVDLGRTGGEDTEFFFRLHRAGWRFAICAEAIVTETVTAERLRLGWLIERRFAEGRHYGALSGRRGLVAAGMAKAGWCAICALAALGRRAALARWGLRGVFHAGVVCGAVAGVGGRRAYG